MIPCTSVDRASFRCSEGRGFESHHGLRILFFFSVLYLFRNKKEVSINFFKAVPKLFLLIFVLILNTVGYGEDNLNHEMWSLFEAASAGSHVYIST